jgi:hypothetical protein
MATSEKWQTSVLYMTCILFLQALLSIKGQPPMLSRLKFDSWVNHYILLALQATTPLTYPALFCQYRHNEMRNTSWRFSTSRQHGNAWHMKHKRQLAHLIQRKHDGHNTINMHNETHIVIYSYHPLQFRHCINFTFNLFPEMHKIIMQSSIFSANQINVREFQFLQDIRLSLLCYWEFWFSGMKCRCLCGSHCSEEWEPNTHQHNVTSQK